MLKFQDKRIARAGRSFARFTVVLLATLLQESMHELLMAQTGVTAKGRARNYKNW
jgi:hypothetical protein